MLGAEPSMLMGNPLVYASPLPAVTRGVKGSRSTRIACRAFFVEARQGDVRILPDGRFHRLAQRHGADFGAQQAEWQEQK